jgi:acetyl-CoA carboxylase biotin carboxyl carrier protein
VALTAKDVAEITRLLEESSFDELSLELDGMKLTLRRGSPARAASVAQLTPQISAPAHETSPRASGPDTGTRSTSGRAPAASAAQAPGSAADLEVHAPLLGTFYRAPKPGAPPFIDVGSLVEEETIVGIIEVMKLMNTVRAGVRGTVTEILARDGVLVEYGETLLRIGRTS